MTRQRQQIPSYSADGPALAAIHDVLADLFDLLDERLPRREGPVPVAEPAPSTPGRTAVPVSEPAPDDPPEVEKGPGPDTQQLPEPPPTSGRGSSAAAWADWATTAGVELTDGASRDDIITACREAGVIE